MNCQSLQNKKKNLQNFIKSEKLNAMKLLGDWNHFSNQFSAMGCDPSLGTIQCQIQQNKIDAAQTAYFESLDKIETAEENIKQIEDQMDELNCDSINYNFWDDYLEEMDGTYPFDELDMDWDLDWQDGFADDGNDKPTDSPSPGPPIIPQEDPPTEDHQPV